MRPTPRSAADAAGVERQLTELEKLAIAMHLHLTHAVGQIGGESNPLLIALCNAWRMFLAAQGLEDVAMGTVEAVEQRSADGVFANPIKIAEEFARRQI